MKNYKKPSWAIKQIVRENGLVEDICEHGIGHPNEEFLNTHPKITKRLCLDIHGCDGCCVEK